jgi:hypothetical protein
MFEGAFSFPATLTPDDLPVLNGMRIGSENYKEALKEIIKAIEDNGEIEVYAEN